MYNNFRAISKLLWAQTQANPQKRDPYLNKENRLVIVFDERERKKDSEEDGQ